MKRLVLSVIFTFVIGGYCSLMTSCAMVARSARAVAYEAKKKAKGTNGDKGNRFDINDGKDKAITGGSLDELRSMNKRPATIGELPREEDIVWAPEDPDVPIAELAGLELEDDKPSDAWYVSYRNAMQESRKTGKPVMIWFTSTRNSPFCVALSNELYSKSVFDSWARENFVRLRIDSNIAGKTDAERTEKRKYVNDLKKRYKVMGHPVTVVLSPRGTLFGSYRGYKRGSSDIYWGRLKNAQRIAQEDYTSWMEEMERKGYRVWHNLNGKSVFAKAARYKDGMIWLIEPDGKKSVTNVNKLSYEDNTYINRKLEESRER